MSTHRLTGSVPTEQSRSRSVPKLVAQLVTIALAFVIGVSVSSPASAASYDRAAAVAYAKKYACNLNTSCRNTAFKSFTQDCTNFVSQALWAGGKPMKQSGPGRIWYWLTKSTYSTSWTTVSGFVAFYKESGKGRLGAVYNYSGSTMKNAYTAAVKGDAYLYDWGTGSGYSHLSISTGYGDLNHYYDPVKEKYYDSVTGGKGDYIAQHASDRDGAPWNWGYWTTKSSVTRSKMKTQVLHFTN